METSSFLIVELSCLKLKKLSSKAVPPWYDLVVAKLQATSVDVSLS